MPVGTARLIRREGGAAGLGAGPWRALFVWKGKLRLTAADGSVRTLSEGDAIDLGQDAWKLDGDEAACCFLWEVAGASDDLPDPGEGATVLERYVMPLLPGEADPTGRDAVLRFERVDLRPGAATPRHTHKGSGLRVLIGGMIDALIGDAKRRLEPGDAWLEKGPGEPVLGQTHLTEPTSFVRLIVMPGELAGQDSFVHLEDGARDRPRPASYQRYFEKRVAL